MKFTVYKKYMASVILAFTFLSKAEAKVTLPAILTDHMVLQQKENVKIWGSSTFAGKMLSIQTSWDNKKYQVQIDEQGNWAVYVKTPAYGGPYQMTIDDGDRLTINNILIGEVWFCSGQSNMEMPLAGSGKINNYQQEIESAHYPNIRILQIPKSTSNLPVHETKVTAGGWREVTPAHIPEFSATAYFFAREIFEKTGIPVGLIHSSWGGTYIEAWMSKQAFDPFEHYHEALKKIEQADIKTADKGPNRPTVLFNAMVQPFTDFKIKGAIWYQGESNTDNQVVPYQELLPALIKDWRAQWQNEQMPFYFVQLANFRPKITQPQGSSWAKLRDAQLHTLEVSNTGMAVIADIGEASDIHPKNKQDVGRRLAFIALHQLYGKKSAYSGPTLKKWTVKGSEIELKFNPMGKKLVVNDLGKYAGGFSVAGSDQKFYAAEIKQRGNSIIISAPEVASPVAVRYGWADNPDLVVYNEAGLPASPFRTDLWELRK